MSIDNHTPRTDGRVTQFSFWPVYLCLFATLLFIATAASLYWPLQYKAFLSDNSPVSWLSSAQLWAMALIALRLAADHTLKLSLALWISFAMLVMAFDEQFMIHEHWKYGCSAWFDACSFAWVKELPILLIAVTGVTTAAWLHNSLPSRAKVVLWLSLATGCLAIFIDLTLSPNSLAPFEEGLEAIAESLFAGLLLGLKTQSTQQPDP